MFVLVSIVWMTFATINGESLVENMMFSVLYASFGVLGLLIASRRPENTLGWVFLAIAIGANAGNLASAYAEYAIATEPGSLPAGAWAAAVGETLWPTAITSILLLLVLFPSGRPASNFQRWLLRGAVVGIAGLALAGFLFDSGRIEVAKGVSVENPFAIAALQPVISAMQWVGAIIPVVAFLAIGALIAQTRRSHGVERQQLKWFGYSALSMVMLNFVLTNIIRTLFPGATVDENAGNVGFVVGLSLLPIGTGVAILKYRLYDLERIVNRTLVYAGLTAVLGGAYLGLVVLLQDTFRPLARDSDLAVAASTLAVAALFRPVRSRLQSFIDHRFYRRKYDAQATLEAFATHLRDEVDLTSLSRKLTTTVGGAMQPAHVSLWLREGSR
jgi:hypothetical protein